LMPSRVEPCGLNQMYSLRYGTILLWEKQVDWRHGNDFGDNGNGISHDQSSVGDICYSIQRAINLYKDKSKMQCNTGMNTDHSWEKACQEYIEVYNLIINKIWKLRRKNVIAIILGGGQGSRLYPLTESRSKPAVPIGGKYRLVDIPISNCMNSDIYRMFVLTQFNSASLNAHIKNTYFSVF
jgi:CTP:phosphocholine cytidylyltransferase-like protein